jgi:hypothetical protein
MKIEFLFKWYDLWIGVFYDKRQRWIYILPIPTLGIILKLPTQVVNKLNTPDGKLACDCMRHRWEVRECGNRFCCNCGENKTNYS